MLSQAFSFKDSGYHKQNQHTGRGADSISLASDDLVGQEKCFAVSSGYYRQPLK